MGGLRGLEQESVRYYWLLCVFLSGYLLDGQGVSLPRVFVRGKEGGTKASLLSTATSHQHSQLSIPSVGLALLLEVPASMCDQDATAGTQDASLYQSTPATIAHAGTSPGRAPQEVPRPYKPRGAPACSSTPRSTNQQEALALFTPQGACYERCRAGS